MPRALIRITEQEVRDMFGDSGNFADYWLNAVPRTSQEGWRSADVLTRRMTQDEADGWSPDQDAAEALTRNEFETGGGLMGATPELTRIRAGLAATGSLLLDTERKRGL